MIVDLKKIGTARLRGRSSTDFLERQTIFYFAERLGQALPESVRSSQNKIKLSHLNHFSPEREHSCPNKNILQRYFEMVKWPVLKTKFSCNDIHQSSHFKISRKIVVRI